MSNHGLVAFVSASLIVDILVLGHQGHGYNWLAQRVAEWLETFICININVCVMNIHQLLLACFKMILGCS